MNYLVVVLQTILKIASLKCRIKKFQNRKLPNIRWSRQCKHESNPLCISESELYFVVEQPSIYNMVSFIPISWL